MSLQDRIGALEKDLQSLSNDVAKDEQARQKLLVVTQQAAAMLENPSETIWRLLLQVNCYFKHREKDLAQDTNASTTISPISMPVSGLPLKWVYSMLSTRVTTPKQPPNWRASLAVASYSSVFHFGTTYALSRQLILSSPYSKAISCHAYGRRDGL